jgi:adenosylcobinamide-GDP ribazoletransferase
MSAAEDDFRVDGRQALLHLAQCVRFYSRIPVPALPFETDPHAIPDFSRAVWILPVAALIIALPSALVLVAAGALWSPMIAATLAVGSLVLTTGAFHEDGLADTADGFGGGYGKERKLEIMSDSRIGTYGGAALVISLLLRIMLLASLVEQLGPGSAALVWLALAGPARVCGLVLIWALPPARPDGKSAAVGRPRTDTLIMAVALSVIFALPCLAATDILPPNGFLALLACYGVAWPMIGLARRMIGGQTGDVAGAVEQCAELTFLLVATAKLYLVLGFI